MVSIHKPNKRALRLPTVEVKQHFPRNVPCLVGYTYLYFAPSGGKVVSDYKIPYFPNCQIYDRPCMGKIIPAIERTPCGWQGEIVECWGCVGMWIGHIITRKVPRVVDDAKKIDITSQVALESVD
jgi:hypothetical protein